MIPPGRYRMTIDVEIREGQGGTNVFALKDGQNYGDLRYPLSSGATFEPIPDPRPEWAEGDLIRASNGRIYERRGALWRDIHSLVMVSEESLPTKRVRLVPEVTP